jgi:uncharacterized protein YdaU (DUF1376 family)
MAKVDTWMPVYIGDYLADTGHLTTEEHGAYLLLMFHYWRKGPLPADESRLGSIAGITGDAWSNAWAMLKQFFVAGEDGRLHHKRIDHELKEAGEKRQKSTERAEKAARARWENAPSNAQASPQALLKECPSPSPIPIKKQKPSSEPEEGSLHVRCRALIHAYWHEFHPEDETAPWGPGEAKQLKSLLAANPGLTEDWFKRLLEYRARSDVNLSQRPMEWLAKLTDFKRGPLNKFKQPKGEGNGKSADNSSTRGAAVGRVERGVAAVGRVAERLGWTGVGSADGPDGEPLSAPGTGGGDADELHARPGGDGSGARHGDGESSTAHRTPAAGPEILPPSHRGG